MILQCDSMQKMPYLGKGCCFMLFDGLSWNFCVILSFTKEVLRYQKFQKSSLLLDNEIFSMDAFALMKGYVIKFVNVFHPELPLLKEYFLHHCITNKYRNVEGMLKPSIWKELSGVTKQVSQKELRLLKKKRIKVKHSLSNESEGHSKTVRGSSCKLVLKRKDVPWHTIYVKKNNISACDEICKSNKLQSSFYIVVPSPIFDAKKENWLVLQSGFRYCYREHYIIDVLYLQHLQKISDASQLHYILGCLSVGSVKLIQPFDCHNTRFCIVNSEQFDFLRKQAGVQSMFTEKNSCLYEYTDKASWNLPGCVVSSWERNENLPEFSMKKVGNISKAVGKGTRRRRTKNKGVYLTLGPRLSSRPRPTPTIQEKNKLL